MPRDYETRSRANLAKVGPDKYAADPSTEVLRCAYAVDDGPMQLWKPGDPVPPEFIEAARNPNWIVCAHNDPFETAIERHIMAPRYGWPLVPIERHVCTMAMALAVGLPAKLSAVADALELANRKDAAGERLMHQMSRSRGARAKMRTPPVRTITTIRNGSIASTSMSCRTAKWSVSSSSGCRCYRRQNKHGGCRPARSTSAASMSTGFAEAARRSRRRRRQRLTPNLLNSPAAPLPESIRSPDCLR